MRTNIELDDALMAAAMELTGLTTKKAVVDKALREMVEELRRRNALNELQGMGWEGDLDAMRLGWGPDSDHAKDAAE